MPTTIPCPRCQRAIEIDNEAADGWFTCPQCLSSVRNPRGELVSTAPSPSAANRCDVCDATLDPKWRYCPQCNTPCARSAGKLLSTNLERDIRADGNVAGWVVGVLCLVVAFVFVTLLSSDVGKLALATPTGGGVLLLVLIAVSFILLGIFGLLRSKGDGSAKAIGSVLGVVAIGAAVALGFVLMICAGIIGFLNDCGKMLGGGR